MPRASLSTSVCESQSNREGHSSMKQAGKLHAHFLQGRYIVSFATLNNDGSIHITAVWFLFQEGSFFVPTSSKSRKARNVLARPQASMMVDARKDDLQRGLTVSGRTEVIEGEPARGINLRIHARYMSTDALRDPQVGPVMLGHDDVTIRLTPERWIDWDLNENDPKIFGGRLFGPPGGYLFPLD